MNWYLLPTEFEVPTASCGPSFFPVDLWPKGEARGLYINGKKRESLTYCTDRENGGSKICIISLRLSSREGKETRWFF